MIAERLRKAVLQAAFEGKLTERLLEDESGDKLISEIKSKFNIKHKLDNCNINCDLFDVPNNWSWATIGEVTTNNGQKKPDKKFTYIDIGSINNKKKILEDNLNILKPNEAPSRARKIVKYFDVIYSTVRPYLMNLAIINREIKPEPIVSTGFAVFKTINEIMSNYVYYYLQSPFFNNYANSSDNSKGVAYPAINDKKLLNAPIPIPPIQEQKRIVEKLEVLLAEIDKLEEDEKALKDLEDKFPEKLKNSILQSAMEGKLTRQLSTDSSILEIVTQDNLNKVMINERQWDIPESWGWIKFSDLVEFKMGKTPERGNPLYWGSEFPWISIADMNGQHHIKKTKEQISKIAVDKYFKERLVPKGTLIMSFKLTVGRTSILEIDALHNEAIISIHPKTHAEVQKYYLFYILPYIANLGDTKDAIKGKTLNSKSISNLLIPLPPIEEQKRIVDKLDELFKIDLLNIYGI